MNFLIETAAFCIGVLLVSIAITTLVLIVVLLVPSFVLGTALYFLIDAYYSHPKRGL